MTSEQAALAADLRHLLAGEKSVREVAMFGGRAFMVNDKIAVSAGKAGDLLVRVDAERHNELTARDGASQAVMGTERTMGPGWIQVSAEALTGDDQLRFWLAVALEHNRAVS